MAAQQQDDDGGNIGRQSDGRDQAGEQAQNAQSDVSRFRVGLKELLAFHLLRVKQADEGRSENALIDYAVQPVDGFLRLLEKAADLAQHQLKGNKDERYNAQDGQRQPPVDRK